MNKLREGKVDLSSIHPSQRREVQRRLKTLFEFEAASGRNNAEKHARELGISTAQFYNLHKSWKLLRDPQALVGRSGSRKKPIKLMPSQRQIVQKVLASAPDALPNELLQMAIAEAGKADVELPHREKLKRYIDAHRKPALPANMIARAEVVIDYTVLDLPVAFDGSRVMRPLAALAIDTRRQSVVGVDLSDGMPTLLKSARVFIAALQKMEDHPKTVAVPSNDDEEWHDFVGAFGRSGIELVGYSPSAYEYGRYAEALFGRRCGEIGLRPRLVATMNKDRTSKLPDGNKALHLNDAQELVRMRILRSDRKYCHDETVVRRLTPLLDFVERIDV